MKKSRCQLLAGAFGLAHQAVAVMMSYITARSSASQDVRAGLSVSGKVGYQKPHLTFEQQVVHLRRKGMLIDDEAWVIARLRQVGYYRLSAYWHPYKLRQSPAGPEGEDLRAGTRFEFVHLLYEYDRRLRVLVLEGVEIIEVSLRVDIAYLLGQRDRFAYLRPELLGPAFSRPDINGVTDHSKWLKGYREKVHRPNEDFTRHLLGKYGEHLPIWASVELWEFNQLCFFLGGLKHEDKLTIAKKYGLSCPKMLLSWLKAIKGIRNHAAHHGRIWNRNMSAQPILPDAGIIPELDIIVKDATRLRQARAGCPRRLMAHLIQVIDPSSVWPSKLKATIRDFPSETGMTIEQMGFPSDWRGSDNQV